MAKTKLTRLRLPAAPKVVPAATVVEIERVVSRAQSQIGLINLILNAKRKDGADLDVGEVYYVWDALDQVERDLINLEFPIGLTYHRAIRADGAA